MKLNKQFKVTASFILKDPKTTSELCNVLHLPVCKVFRWLDQAPPPASSPACGIMTSQPSRRLHPHIKPGHALSSSLRQQTLDTIRTKTGSITTPGDKNWAELHQPGAQVWEQIELWTPMASHFIKKSWSQALGSRIMKLNYDESYLFKI